MTSLVATNFAHTISNSVRRIRMPMVSRAEMRECIKSNLTFNEVRQKYPISKTTYMNLLKEYGFQKDTIRVRHRNNQLMIDMYKAGASIEEIARARNINEKTCKSQLYELRTLGLLN